MNERLKVLLENYAALEQSVQELIGAQCGSLCGFCTTACCCRADLCEEALESPFLRLLHGRHDLESDSYGFLTETGCALPCGRPPICYEFFCEDVLDAQPDDLHRRLLKILGRLPAHAGECLMDLSEEALRHLDFQTLEKQMQESFQALEIIQRFYNEKTLSDESGRVLSLITLPADD